MSFDTDWDVNKYRYHYELPHHWELKRKFILFHKKKFPEDRLVCLAQIFCNVHYLGCRYGDEVMELIDELTQGLFEKSEKFESKSFALASDAVEAKVKAFTGQTPSSHGGTVRRTTEPIAFVRASEDGASSSTPQELVDLTNSPPSRKRPTDGSINGSDPKSSKYYHDNTPSQQYHQQNQQQFRRPNQQFNQQFNRQQQNQDSYNQYNSQQNRSHNQSYNQQNQQYGQQQNQQYSNQQSQQYGNQQNKPYGQQHNQQYGRQQNQQYGQQENQQYGHQQINQQYGQHQNQRYQSNQSNQRQNKIYSFETRRAMARVKDVVESGPFGKVVVFKNAHTDDGVINIIERAANAAHMAMSFTFSSENGDSTTNCKFSLDGMYVADGEGKTKRLAKEAACRLALERLRETSFTIEVKERFIGGGNTVGRDLEGKGTKGGLDVPLAENNIGSKMLKMMGWTGGGLGKEEQGIEEPIKPYDQNIKRGGLGITNFSDFRKKVSRIIEDYARSDDKNDLVFSPDFTKDERKTIHELVRKYNLKSRSFGKNEDNRHIVVFRKITPLEIVEELIVCGGETQKYKLISPEPKTK